MPELRHDPLTGRSVIVAAERAARPDTFRRPPPSLAAVDAACPFCPGNEHETPPEVCRTGPGPPDTPGWAIRVVPNLYPIVGAGPPGVTGAHEVVILSPAHDRSFAALDPGQAVAVLAVLRDRAARHLAGGHAHSQPFVNHGRAAGGSIEHPHAQIVALDFVPPGVTGALGRFADAGADPVAEALGASAGGACAVVDGGESGGDHAPAWCPPASASPFEVLVAHPGAGARFDEAADGEIAAVASTAREVLARLAAALGDVPYNLTVHTAPAGAPPRAFHWYVRITPRLTVRAGFEQATGVLVNVVPPEAAAATLRAASPASFWARFGAATGSA